MKKIVMSLWCFKDQEIMFFFKIVQELIGENTVERNMV